jgi:hypothetical protein
MAKSLAVGQHADEVSTALKNTNKNTVKWQQKYTWRRAQLQR